MENFDLHILGCGSALPTTRHNPTSQALHLRGKIYLIDCGEGAQLSIRRAQLQFSKIHSIYISHLHGDHCFGLPGLLSTMALLGRLAALPIYGPWGIKDYVREIEQRFLTDCPFTIEVRECDCRSQSLVHEDASVKVYSIPLSHRIPTIGYLFEEKCAERHLDKPSADFYKVPIAYYQHLLAGKDYITDQGEVISNAYLTKMGRPPRRYAFCSDTKYYPPIIELVRGVDLLYHETTFGDDLLHRAEATAHSTARQAATIAREAGVKKLLIGHYSSRYESSDALLQEAREEFPNTDAAFEGLCINL